MEKRLQEEIERIFNSKEICPAFAQKPIKIERFDWNGDLNDFVVEYLD